jgi:hypothetical protein
MSNTDSQIDSFLSSNLDSHIRETAELCAQPSVSAREKLSADFWNRFSGLAISV